MTTTLRIGLPAGIGDVSWAYSKLHCAPPEYDFAFDIADGWPHRTVEFCRLLPRVVEAKYDCFNYSDVVSFQMIHKFNTFEEIAKCGFGRYLMAPNPHLEMGRRLEEWLPDLATDFHYNLNTNQESVNEASRLIRDMDGVRIGVSAASYRGSEAWDTWRTDRWNRFLDMISEYLSSWGYRVTFVLMGGFWDDLTYALAKRDDAVELVGKTDIATAYEMIRLLYGYIGFSSGLGVLATLLRRPTVMLWPAHQVELSKSWVSPEMLSDGSYVPCQWIEPFEVFELVQPWIRRHVAALGD